MLAAAPVRDCLEPIVIALLGLLFLVVPIAELYVIVQVAGEIGVGSTLLLLIGISLAGAWLAKREGVGVLRRLQRTVSQGRVPSREIIDGALILFAAALMLTPGFLTDCLALLLLLPPSRIALRTVLLRQIRQRGRIVTVITSTPRGRAGGAVWDAEGWEEPPPGRHPEIDQ